MISIQEYRSEHAAAAASIIHQTYAKYNKEEGTAEAVEAYLSHSDPVYNLSEIEARFSRTQFFFLALDGDTVVGLVRGFGNRVVNLFVAGHCHRQGTGTALLRRFESECRNAGYKEIVLRASLFAIPFYQAMGYKKTTGVRNFCGLKVQPMRKQL